MSVKLFHPGAGHELSLVQQAVSAADTVVVAPLASSRLVWMCRGLCLTGLGISGYLAWSALQMQPVAGCGAAGVVNCEHVLGSEWSKVAGMPVSIPAVALYGSLLAVLSFANRPASVAFHKLLWQFLTTGFLAAGLAAIWFISIQIGVIGHICPWCMGAHTCSLILAGTALFKAPVSLAVRQQSGAVAVLAAGLLAIVQLGAEPPEPVVIPAVQPPAGAASESELFAPPTEAEVFAPPTAATLPGVRSTDVLRLLAMNTASLSRTLVGGFLFSADEGTDGKEAADGDKGTDGERVGDGNSAKPAPVAGPPMVEVSLGGSRQPVQLDVNSWPLLGSSNATRVFVELLDYTCPHCRANHVAITNSMKTLGPGYAMIALPVPLNSFCNSATQSRASGACELSELAVAVWRCNSAVFPQYHDWLMKTARDPATAKAHAESLVGKTALDVELQSGKSAKYVQKHVDLYRMAGAGVLPKLLLSDRVVEGRVGAQWLQNVLPQLRPVETGLSQSGTGDATTIAGQPSQPSQPSQASQPLQPTVRRRK